MQILRNRKELEHLLAKIREKDHQIGLIPTMGSIHEGHLSLVKKSTQKKLFSLTTIYINPTQFNDREDYLNYPKEETKDIEKLTTPFYRIIKEGDNRRPGFGLGLTICKKIIKAHKGTLSIASEIGNGSTFSLMLPLN